MIVKGNQRAGARALARHLLNGHDNDHVEVGDIRGLAATDLMGAFIEVEAVAKGTSCRQPFFSVSFNPPESESPTLADFEDAFTSVERSLGLENQPRAVVFHEKEGRRHAHVVWSRIDVDRMRAIQLSFFKRRLTDVSRELYLMHGWRMPPGLEDAKQRDPLNFTREEAQLAKRLQAEPKQLKDLIQLAAARADDLKSLAAAMAEQGFTLAKGDRRGLVLVDYRGGVHALARALGTRTKELRARFGEDHSGLPDIQTARAELKQQVWGVLETRLASMEATHRKELAPLVKALHALRDTQRAARHALGREQAIRFKREETARMDRFRKGLKGLWDRLTGAHSRTAKLNLAERDACAARDKAERDLMIRDQMVERRALGEKMKALKVRHGEERDRLRSFVGRLLGEARPGGAAGDRSPSMMDDLKRQAEERLYQQMMEKRNKPRDRDRD